MRFLKPLLIFCGVCVALFVLIEVVVRLLFPVPLEPPGNLTLTNQLPGVKEKVDFSYDSDRLRKLNWGDKKKSDGIRILCFGGNGTTALLQSNSDAWWGNLARDLGNASGKAVGSASLAAVEGGKMLPAAIAAEDILKKYEVDLVIAMFGFADAIATPGDFKYSPSRADALRVREPVGIKYRLAKASHLLRMIRNSRTAKAQQRYQSELSRPNYYRDWLMARAQYYASRPMADGISRSGDDPLLEYLDGIEVMAAAAEKNGAKLLIVGEPTIFKSSLGPGEAGRLTVLWNPLRPVEGQEGKSGFRVRPLAVETELQRFANASEQKCGELGIPWTDLQGKVPRFGDYFVTETYLTDQGSKVVAEKLLPVVAGILGLEGVEVAEESVADESGL